MPCRRRWPRRRPVPPDGYRRAAADVPVQAVGAQRHSGAQPFWIPGPLLRIVRIREAEHAGEGQSHREEASTPGGASTPGVELGAHREERVHTGSGALSTPGGAEHTGRSWSTTRSYTPGGRVNRSGSAPSAWRPARPLSARFELADAAARDRARPPGRSRPRPGAVRRSDPAPGLERYDRLLTATAESSTPATRHQMHFYGAGRWTSRSRPVGTGVDRPEGPRVRGSDRSRSSSRRARRATSRSSCRAGRGSAEAPDGSAARPPAHQPARPGRCDPILVQWMPCRGPERRESPADGRRPRSGGGPAAIASVRAPSSRTARTPSSPPGQGGPLARGSCEARRRAPAPAPYIDSHDRYLIYGDASGGGGGAERVETATRTGRHRGSGSTLLWADRLPRGPPVSTSPTRRRSTML